VSGFAIGMGACVGCQRMFTFNPVRVPSAVVNGTREPVCPACMVIVNARRRAAGLADWPIPADAYDPVAEEEI
jgi:hypothetical protein